LESLGIEIPVLTGTSAELPAELPRYRCPDWACPGGMPGACGSGLKGATCGACPEKQFFAEVWIVHHENYY